MKGTGTLPMTEFSAQFFGGLRMTSFRDDGRRRDETIRSLSGLPKPRARRQKARRADLRPIRPPVPGAGPAWRLTVYLNRSSAAPARWLRTPPDTPGKSGGALRPAAFSGSRRPRRPTADRRSGPAGARLPHKSVRARGSARSTREFAAGSTNS